MKILRLVIDGHQDPMAKDGLAHRVIFIRVGELDHWVKGLLCKREDLNRDPLALMQKFRHHGVCNSRTQMRRQRILGAHV